jgi:hypothetical protein
MAVTGRRPAEIFFSAAFAPLDPKLPFPAVIFSGQLKTRLETLRALALSPTLFRS